MKHTPKSHSASVKRPPNPPDGKSGACSARSAACPLDRPWKTKRPVMTAASLHAILQFGRNSRRFTHSQTIPPTPPLRKSHVLPSDPHNASSGCTHPLPAKGTVRALPGVPCGEQTTLPLTIRINCSNHYSRKRIHNEKRYPAGRTTPLHTHSH